MKTRHAFLILAVALSVFSCKKQLSATSSKKDLLTGKAWVVKKAEEKNNTEPWTDVFPLWDACYKDNTWRFNADFTMEYNEAALACGADSPNQVLESSTWSFSDNETKITADDVTYSIEQLDATTFVIVESETVAGATSSRRVTFGH